MNKINLEEKDLIKPSMNVSAANSSSMTLLGAVLAKVTGKNKHTKEVRETKQMIYITENVDEFFLSKSASRDLGIISYQFPTIADPKSGRTNSATNHKNDKVNEAKLNSVIENNDESDFNEYSCIDLSAKVD